MSKLDYIMQGFDDPWYMGEEAPIKTRKDAKEAIKALMLELIGEDEYPAKPVGEGYEAAQRDNLRMELRKKVEAL